jgi:hypothetical protein
VDGPAELLVEQNLLRESLDSVVGAYGDLAQAFRPVVYRQKSL